MANDSTMWHQLLIMSVKVLMWIGIFVAWRMAFKKAFIPWGKSQENATDAIPGKPFPIWSLIGVVLLALGGFWFTTFELTYRQVAGVTNHTLQDNLDRQEQERDKQSKEVHPDTSETLKQKSQRMLDEAKAQNERAKQNFDNQPKPPK